MQNYFKEERKKGRGRRKEGKGGRRKGKKEREKGRKEGREKMRDRKEASLLHAWATVRYSALGLVIFLVFVT